MKVLCVKKGSVLLTLNKWYDVDKVAKEKDGLIYYLISTDAKDLCEQWMLSKYFKTIEQIREEKLNELLN